MTKSGLKRLQFSAKVVSDSTLIGFRLDVCMQLRAHGYDVKYWLCTSGAEEEQVAVDIACSGFTDLAIAAPKGNRLAK